MDPTQAKASLRAAVSHQATLAVPLDLSCLWICCLAGRDIEVDEELAALDVLAGRVETPTFDGIVAALFDGPNAFRGNDSAYYDIGNSLLSDVRRTRLGIPITLAVLAMEVGRRRNVAMAGIGMPGHFLLGDATRPDRFVDPFSGGRVFAGDTARAIFARLSGGAAAWSDAYLRPVSNGDILFRILNNIKVASAKSFADRQHLPWVLEALSWFPQGQPFDSAVAARIVSPFN